MSPKNWLNRCIGGVILVYLFFGPCLGKIDEGMKYLEQSVSFFGSTGWINIPSASVSDHLKLTAGIHRGFAKLNIGLFGLVEAGILFEADRLGKQFRPYQNLSSWEAIEKNGPAFIREAFKGQGKLKLLDQHWAMINLSLGREQQHNYVVVHRHLGGLSDTTLLAGWGEGRFEKGFFGISKMIFSGAEMIFEYDGDGFNVGYRLLLGPNLILSLAGKELDTIWQVQNLGEVISRHLIFGVTYVEQLW